jgi:hypothetical protein
MCTGANNQSWKPLYLNLLENTQTRLPDFVHQTVEGSVGLTTLAAREQPTGSQTVLQTVFQPTHSVNLGGWFETRCTNGHTTWPFSPSLTNPLLTRVVCGQVWAAAQSCQRGLCLQTQSWPEPDRILRPVFVLSCHYCQNFNVVFFLFSAISLMFLYSHANLFLKKRGILILQVEICLDWGFDCAQASLPKLGMKVQNHKLHCLFSNFK